MTGNVKKIGDPRTETVKVELTEIERQDARATACDLRDQLEKLKEEAKTIRAGFAQRIKDLAQRELECRQRASTGIDHVAVVVQDHLTAGNEVVAVEIKTGLPVARRTATADELQEDLFGGDGPEEASLS